jgi:hypothetical protein
MERFYISREVIETLVVEAESEEEAQQLADETPIDEWVRDIKYESVV